MNGQLLLAKPRSLAVATSIAVHAAALGGLAAFAAVSLPVIREPVRVVIIDVDAGGGGSAGPVRKSAPGEMAGPTAPAVTIEPPSPPPPPQRSAPEAPRIAAKPRKDTKPKPPAPRAQASRPPARQTEPTPGGTTDGNSQLALSTGSGGGGGGGNGTGGGSGSGTGTGVGAGRGPGIEAAIAKYLRTVRTRLEAVKRYPILARRRGTEGTATIAIDIERNGDARTVRVSDSSGSDLLDEEAAEMVGRAAPFDPLPAEVDETTLRVVVPVSFDLDS